MTKAKVAKKDTEEVCKLKSRILELEADVEVSNFLYTEIKKIERSRAECLREMIGNYRNHINEIELTGLELVSKKRFWKMLYFASMIGLIAGSIFF